MKSKIKRSLRYWVYMVECKNGTLYTGYTNNVEKRIELHNKGYGAKYLRGKGPVKLVYCKGYRSRKYVMRVEKEIKTYTRKEKEELIKAYENTRL